MPPFYQKCKEVYHISTIDGTDKAGVLAANGRAGMLLQHSQLKDYLAIRLSLRGSSPLPSLKAVHDIHLEFEEKTRPLSDRRSFAFIRCPILPFAARACKTR